MFLFLTLRFILVLYRETAFASIAFDSTSESIVARSSAVEYVLGMWRS